MSRVFVITGASSGIGAATARRAVEAGYRVVLAARSKDKLDGLVEELGGAEHALAIETDVTEWEANEALIAAATETFGQVDVVFARWTWCSPTPASAPSAAGSRRRPSTGARWS
jgi:NADP-dependent 3-hydroxy acid dehydrogenase YdfG